MSRHTHQAPLWPIARATIGLEILLSLGALAGGLALMIGPRGEIIPLPLTALEGSPFRSHDLQVEWHQFIPQSRAPAGA